ncbi:MAG: ABC transporter permease, partial [Burkholderiales bacterium]|nr:ABC transporter permease [Burkholderiales bacterium]
MSWLDRPASPTQITHRGRLWLYMVAALALAFLALPTLIVVPMSFSGAQYLEFPPREWSLRWYASYFESRSWMQATATSFKAAALTALVATPLGTLAAYGLAASRFRWTRAVHVLLITPMIVPVIL